MPTNNYCFCAGACETPQPLPALPINQDCVTASDFLKSQINWILIRPNKTAAGVPNVFPNNLTAAAILPSINNADVLNAFSKYLVGEGSVSEPTEITKDAPKGKTIVVERQWVLTLNVKQLPDSTYNFLKNLQCGATDFSFMYGTEKHMFTGVTTVGANEYLYPKSVSVSFPQGGGKDDESVGILKVTFAALCDPNRVLTVL